MHTHVFSAGSTCFRFIVLHFKKKKILCTAQAYNNKIEVVYMKLENVLNSLSTYYSFASANNAVKSIHLIRLKYYFLPKKKLLRN